MSPKESINKSNDKGGNLENSDSLQKAAQQISEIDDNELAKMFIEANEKARLLEEAELFEIYSEQEKEYEFEEHSPDPEFLKSIGDSLKNKEFHHKKLLDEDISLSFFGRIFFSIKKFFSIPTKHKFNFSMTPLPWKMYLISHKFWKKKINLILDDFSSFIDLWLRNEKKTKRILKYETFVFLFSFLANIILLSKNSQMFDSFKKEGDSSLFDASLINFWSNLNYFLSLFSFIFILIPPLFLMVLWFANVNYLYTSKNFHFFVFIFFTISSFLLFLSLFNVFIFFAINNFEKVSEFVISFFT